MSSPQTLTWLVTGCSTGIGRSIVLYALSQKQRVIATGRNASRLSDLGAKGAHVEEIDVNASPDIIDDFAAKILKKYGPVDVLVNNAGYVASGTVEEAGHDALAAQFHTNVFSVINVTRAFLPSMRERHSGTIFMISSVVAYTFYPGMGLYDASKAALRALSTSLSKEIAPLGIRLCQIEPGLFRTAVFNSHNSKPSESTNKSTPPVPSSTKPGGPRKIADYAAIREWAEGFLRDNDNTQNGDPDKLAAILCDLALGTGVAKGREFPAALVMGGDAVRNIRGVLKNDLERLDAWEAVSASTNFDE